jgi:hypothetical protein
MKITDAIQVLALILLCGLATHARAQEPPPPDVTVQSETITATETREALRSVTTRSSVIESGADVTARAGESIRLEAGFEVEKRATFRAEVAETGPGMVLEDRRAVRRRTADRLVPFACLIG